MFATLGALAVGLGPSVARAHADLDPLHDHRVLSVHITDAGLQLAYVLAFSAATSEELRRDADANHDGRLARDEVPGLIARVTSLSRGLSTDLDGAQIAFADVAPKVEGAEGEVTGPREIAVRWERRVLPTTTAPHRLQVADGTKLARPGDLHVRISGEGQSRVLGVDHRVESRLGFIEAAFHRQDACQTTRCTAEVRFLGGGVASSAGSGWLAGIAVLCLGVVTFAWYALRRRQTPAVKRATPG